MEQIKRAESDRLKHSPAQSNDSNENIRITLDFRELRWLKFFLTLAEAGHVGRAANQLAITQSALSQHIAAFEQEIGSKLFARHSRGVSLTHSGIQLRRRLEIVTPILTAPLTGINASLKTSQKLRIGVPAEYCALLMPRIIRDVVQARKDLEVEVTDLASSNVEEALTTRSIDVAFIPNVSSSTESLHEPIAREELGLVSAPRAEAGERPLRLRELAGFSIILPSHRHPFSRVLAKACSEHNVQLKPLYQTDSFVLRKELVRQLRSSTILPQAAVREELAAGTLEFRSIIDPKISTTLSVACSLHPAPSIGSDLLGAMHASLAQLAREGQWPGAVPLPLALTRCTH